MKYSSLKIFTLSLITATSAFSQDAGDGAVREIQNKQFEAALKVLDGDLATLATEKRPVDYLLLLKARAQFLSEQHDKAVATCKKLIADHPTSPWMTKATFLQAQALSALKKHDASSVLFETEAEKLFSPAYKDKGAKLLIEVASALSSPQKEGKNGTKKPTSSDLRKADALLTEALDLNCSESLKETILHQRILLNTRRQTWGSVSKLSLSYLNKYDPQWRGTLESVERITLQKNSKKAILLTGENRFTVRFHLAEALHRADEREQAARYLSEMISLLEKDNKPQQQGLLADATWLHLMATREQGGQPLDTDLWLKNAKAYVKKFPTHIHANSTVYTIALVLEEQASSEAAKAEQAVAAFNDYLNNSYQLKIAENPLTARPESKVDYFKRLEKTNKRKEDASYRIGRIYLRSHQFDKAQQAWNNTAKNYPSGKRWADCQKGLVDIQFQRAIHEVAQITKADDAEKANARTKAQAALQTFIKNQPLDSRISSVLYLIGNIHFQHATSLDAQLKKTATPALKAEQEQALKDTIASWKNLINTYPKSTHAREAKYLTAMIYEDRIGDLDKALELYRSSTHKDARNRVTILTAEKLTASSEKIWTSNEAPQISLNSRNVEEVTVSQYWLDIESYFRKGRQIHDINSLDIDLVEADKTWKLKLPNYKKLVALESKIDIPFPANKAGICVVKIESKKFSATTVIIRSDIDLSVRKLDNELVAYVFNARTKSPAAKVKVLIADAGKIITTGTTDANGICHIKDKKIDEIKGLRILAISDSGSATCGAAVLGNGNIGHGVNRASPNYVPLPNQTQSTHLLPVIGDEATAATAFFNTAKQAYLPGETISLSGMVRFSDKGIFILPTEQQKNYTLTIRNNRGFLHSTKVTLNERGIFSYDYKLPNHTKQGNITLTLNADFDKKISIERRLSVTNANQQSAIITLNIDKQIATKNDILKGTITAKYRWGAVFAHQRIDVRLPNSQKITLTTDASGKATFQYDTAYSQQNRLGFQAISNSGQSAYQQVLIDPNGFSIRSKINKRLQAAGAPVELKLKTVDPLGKPVSRDISVEIYQVQATPIDAILNSCPSLDYRSQAHTEPIKVLQKIDLKTDPKTGEIKHNITLDKAGLYNLRITGKDKAGRKINNHNQFNLHGDDSKKKLIIHQPKTAQVGKQAKIEVYSYFKAPVKALLTVETNNIRQKKIITLAPGKNAAALDLDASYLPIARVTLSIIDERQFYFAQTSIAIANKLTIKSTITKINREDGLKLSLKLQAFDANEQAVATDYFINLLEKYDFQRNHRMNAFINARHLVNYQSFTNCGFRHQARQQPILTDVRNELKRLANAESNSIRRYNNPVLSGSGSTQRLAEVRKLLYRGESYYNQGQYDQATNEYKQILRIDPYNKPARRGMERVNAAKSSYYRAAYDQTRAAMLMDVDESWGLNDFDNGVSGQLFNGIPNIQSSNVNNITTGGLRSSDFAVTRDSIDAFLNNPNRSAAGAAGELYFNPAWSQLHHIPKEGKEITIEVPANQHSPYQLEILGFSDKLAAGSKVEAIDANPHQLTCQAPNSLTLGDTWKPIITLKRNGSDAIKKAETITVNADINGTKKDIIFVFNPDQTTQTIQVDAVKTTKIGAVNVALSSPHASYQATIEVLPNGIPVLEQKNLTLKQGVQEMKFNLPANATASDLLIHLATGPAQVLESVANSALISPFGSQTKFRQEHPAGKLLAACSLLDYLTNNKAKLDPKSADVPRQMLQEVRQTQALRTTISRLCAELSLTQKSDGSWSEITNRRDSSLLHTVISYQALLKAKSLNIAFGESVLKRTKRWIEAKQKSLPIAQYNYRSLVQYALSLSSDADFATCNRLYRERNKLDNIGKAILANTFANLDRKEYTKTLLQEIAKQPKASVTLAEEQPLNSAALLQALVTQAKLANNQNTKPSDIRLSFSDDIDRGISAHAYASYFKNQAVAPAAPIKLHINGKNCMISKIIHLTKHLKKGENVIRIEATKSQGAINASLSMFTAPTKIEKVDSYHINDRKYYRQSPSFNGRKLRAAGTSETKTLALGEALIVTLEGKISNKFNANSIITEDIPDGFEYLPGSLRGNHSGARLENNQLIVTYGSLPDKYKLRYTLIAKRSGTWQHHPALLSPTFNTATFTYNNAAELTILDQGKNSQQPYQYNAAEHYELAKLKFGAEQYEQAKKHILAYRKQQKNSEDPELARMLLWIETEKAKPNAQLLADSFEVLTERNPDLVIPFEKILKVGKAYRELGEFERAKDVYTATLEAGYTADSYVGAALEDQGKFMDSVEFQNQLWMLYPDLDEITSARFALAQQLFDTARKAEKIKLLGDNPTTQKPYTEKQLMQLSLDYMEDFLTHTPTHELAEDTAFSIVNALFALKRYQDVIDFTKDAIATYKDNDDSKHSTSFRYMHALGQFWLRNYPEALKAASAVAKGKSEDKNLASFITAQIYHAKGQPAEAIKWYNGIKERYPDALKSIAYFEGKSISFDEVKLLNSGENATLKLNYRNIKEVQLQIYRVDLMKLYLREKNLSNISKINLAGINPKHNITIKLGDGKDYQPKEKIINLPIKDDGAYLIMCRGDYIHTSGLTLITPLKMDVQEYPNQQMVRVNVTDKKSGKYLDSVHVKAVGAGGKKLKSGETDLRGVWQTEAINSPTTIIARDPKGRYTFFRSKLASVKILQNAQRELLPKSKVDFNQNLDHRQDSIRRSNLRKYEQKRRSKGKGVEIQKARKKK